MLCPQQVDEIDHLDNQIKGGTTVVLALIYNNHLYVANVGDSRALLCTYVSWSVAFCVLTIQLQRGREREREEEIGSYMYLFSC